MSPVHKVMAKANARAERLRPVMVNERKMPAPLGGRWYRAQVIRLRNRLAATAPPH
jgi:hypothetical protein